jgi:hypothetical protein
MAQQDSVAAAARDLQVYQSLREYEEHFNRTQVETKKLASAWMLATFGAIAFIVRGDLAAKESLLDSGSLLVLIGLGGNIGLLSLWILDQQVNQRLLGAPFRVGMLLERSNPGLPPIRSKMWLNSRSHGMGRLHSFFYACPMAFNLGAQIYGLTQSLPEYFRWLLILSIAGAATFLWPFVHWVSPWFETPDAKEEKAIKTTVAQWESKRKAHGDLPDQT